MWPFAGPRLKTLSVQSHSLAIVALDHQATARCQNGQATCRLHGKVHRKLQALLEASILRISHFYCSTAHWYHWLDWLCLLFSGPASSLSARRSLLDFTTVTMVMVAQQTGQFWWTHCLEFTSLSVMGRPLLARKSYFSPVSFLSTSVQQVAKVQARHFVQLTHCASSVSLRPIKRAAAAGAWRNSWRFLLVFSPGWQWRRLVAVAATCRWILFVQSSAEQTQSIAFFSFFLSFLFSSFLFFFFFALKRT